MEKGIRIVRDRIRNLSVRKTIILYLAISLVCSFLLSAAITRLAYKAQQRIWWKYTDQERYFEAIEKEEGGYLAEIQRPDSLEMLPWDRTLNEVCDFLDTYTVLILSIAGSCLAVFLFYRHKLRIPMEELRQASKRIAKNDLDFVITYDNQDEMGSLCREFERMRGELAGNNREMWRMLEDERELRAAIAHDVRSPLAVLKGYLEMLTAYLPDGTIDPAKALEMLAESRKQIERMDVFVETMQKLNSLEQRTLLPGPVTAGSLQEEIQAELDILGQVEKKRIILQVPETDAVFSGDREIILEVMENLLSNGLQYAKDSLKYAGMGMYISRLYCEKHGGMLLLENEEQGGAAVTAVFYRIG